MAHSPRHPHRSRPPYEHRAGGGVDRGQRPQDRGARPRHHAADPPVRADRAAAVRVRARSRPWRAAPGRARLVLGHGPARRALGDLARLQHRGRARRARRAAAVRPRRQLHLPRQGRRARAGAARLRGPPHRGRRRPLRCAPRIARPARPRDARRDGRIGGRRYPLRRSRGWDPSARDVGAGVAAACGRAGAAGCHPRVGGIDRRRHVRRLAVDRAARDLRRVVRRNRDAGLRAAAGGIVSADAVTAEAAPPRRTDDRLMAPVARWIVAVAALISLAALVVVGLFVAPADAVQGDAQRLMYLHVPAAWVAYLAFGVTALASVLYLVRRTRSLVWDRVAGASAELGVIFTGLTLLLGSLWGRPVWG